MNFEKLKNQLSQNFQTVNEDVNKTLSQLLNQKVSIDAVSFEKTAEITEEKYPVVSLSFLSGGSINPAVNIVAFSKDLAISMLSWITGESSKDDLSEDHFEAIKEIFERLIDGIKISFPDDKATLQIEKLKVFQANELKFLDEFKGSGEGIIIKYELETTEKKYPINQYVWSISTEKTERKDSMVENKENTSEAMETGKVNVQPAEFTSIEKKGIENEVNGNVDMLLDVELDVTVELGKKSILISDIFKLGIGSIVELDKFAGENLDILVNSKKIAEGEVVVVDDQFGIRITQLANPKERLKSLG